MANPNKMWPRFKHQAAAASIKLIFSPPALNIYYCAKPNWCSEDAFIKCRAGSYMKRYILVRDAAWVVMIYTCMWWHLHGGLREPITQKPIMLQSPVFRVHYSSTHQWDARCCVIKGIYGLSWTAHRHVHANGCACIYPLFTRLSIGDAFYAPLPSPPPPCVYGP